MPSDIETTDINSEYLNNSERVGPFVVSRDSPNTLAFATMVSNRFKVHQESLGLVEPTKPVELHEVDAKKAAELLRLIGERFSAEHHAKFGVVVHGIFTTADFENLDTVLDNKGELVFHGTDPSRGELILTDGFMIPKERKVDQHPMYGTGVCITHVFSKASPYFQESGYSSRERAEGLIFAIHPERGRTYQAKSALWGNMVNYDGQTIDWRDEFASIEALPKGKGGDVTASNFPELTLKSGDQARSVAVVWAELIPRTDPDYFSLGLDQNPVKNDTPHQAQPESVLSTEHQSAGPSLLTRKLMDLIRSAELPAEAVKPSADPEVERLSRELGVRVVKEFDTATENGLKVGYEFDHEAEGGLELSPNEAVLVNIPDNFQGDLRNVVLRHRKSDKRWYPGRTPRRWVRIKASEVRSENGHTSVLRRGTANEWFILDPNISHLIPKGGGTYNERDSNPAKTAVYVHDVSTDRWVFLDTKIGEPRPASEPEEERLHDLQFNGKVDRILLVGKGEGDPALAVTNLHGVDIVRYPDLKGQALKAIEQVFTRGVKFFDPSDSTKRESAHPTDRYGQERWGYPNAVVIGGDKEQSFTTFPKNLLKNTEEEIYVQGDDLHIKLPAGKKFKSLEVACGDMVYGSSPSQNRNGWAELEADLVQKSKGKVDTVITGDSVPPYGILSGAPKNEYITHEGDEIVLRSTRHPAWVMGFRVLLA